MVPARTTSPVWRFTPRRFALESRPLRELPPPFLCAISGFLLGFRRPRALRGGGLLSGRLGCLSRGLFHCVLSHGNLGLDRLRLGRDRLGLGFEFCCLRNHRVCVRSFRSGSALGG